MKKVRIVISMVAAISIVTLLAFVWYIFGDSFIDEFTPREHPLSQQITENIPVSVDSLESIIIAAEERAKYYREDAGLCSIHMVTDLEGNPTAVTCYFSVPYVDTDKPFGTIMICIDIGNQLLRLTNLDYSGEKANQEPTIQIENASRILTEMLDNAFQSDSDFVKKKEWLRPDVDFYIWPYSGRAEIVGAYEGITKAGHILTVNLKYTLETYEGGYRLIDFKE